ADPAGLAGTVARIGSPARPLPVGLALEGMTCASCTGRVERVLKAQPGVISASANLATRRATVEVLEAGCATALARAVTKAGFKAAPLSAAQARAPASDPGRDARILWRETWIAVALTLPVFITEMGGHLVPSFHHWLHMEFGTSRIWLMQFLLTSLVLAFPGRR